MFDIKKLIGAGHKVISSVSAYSVYHAMGDYSDNIMDNKMKTEALGSLQDYMSVINEQVARDSTSPVELVDSDDDQENDPVTLPSYLGKKPGTLKKLAQSIGKIMTMPQANKAITDLTSEKVALANRVSELEKFVEAATATNEELVHTLGSKEVEYKNKLDALTLQIETEKASMTKKVQAEIQSVGLKIGTIKEEIGTNQSEAAKEVLEKFESIPAGKDRTEFWKANEKLIVQGARERRNNQQLSTI